MPTPIEAQPPHQQPPRGRFDRLTRPFRRTPEAEKNTENIRLMQDVHALAPRFSRGPIVFSSSTLADSLQQAGLYTPSTEELLDEPLEVKIDDSSNVYDKKRQQYVRVGGDVRDFYEGYVFDWKTGQVVEGFRRNSDGRTVEYEEVDRFTKMMEVIREDLSRRASRFGVETVRVADRYRDQLPDDIFNVVTDLSSALALDHRNVGSTDKGSYNLLAMPHSDPAADRFTVRLFTNTKLIPGYDMTDYLKKAPVDQARSIRGLDPRSQDIEEVILHKSSEDGHDYTIRLQIGSTDFGRYAGAYDQNFGRYLKNSPEMYMPRYDVTLPSERKVDGLILLASD